MVKGAVSGEFHSPGGEDHLGCLGEKNKFRLVIYKQRQILMECSNDSNTALNRLCTVKSPVSVEISSKYTKRIFEHHEEVRNCDDYRSFL